MEGADGTGINANHLAYIYRTKMKGEESIKERGGNGRGGSRNLERNTIATEN